MTNHVCKPRQISGIWCPNFHLNVRLQQVQFFLLLFTVCTETNENKRRSESVNSLQWLARCWFCLVCQHFSTVQRFLPVLLKVKSWSEWPDRQGDSTWSLQAQRPIDVSPSNFQKRSNLALCNFWDLGTLHTDWTPLDLCFCKAFLVPLAETKMHTEPSQAIEEELFLLVLCDSDTWGENSVVCLSLW